VPPLGRCLLIRMTLKDLIDYANSRQLSPIQIDAMIKGGPSWANANTDRYDIEAKADDSSVTKAQLLAMLQSLLADRFKLQLHYETKEVPGYALVVAKNGPKLVESKKPDQFPTSMGRPGQIVAMNANLSQSLLRVLNAGNLLDGPVVDKTGIVGQYDFTLIWSPETGNANATDPAGPSLFTALQEQLGLRLEREKAIVEMIVIDHVERPDAN
jgi:uncharacterized protein (TIGR03435 family)